MRRSLCLLCTAILLVGCDGYKGHVQITSLSPDGRASATVSCEGDDNSRDSVHHVYLSATEGGTPDEVINATGASVVYVRWESDSRIMVVFNGGTIQFTHGAVYTIPVQIGDEKRLVSISLTTRMGPPD